MNKKLEAEYTAVKHQIPATRTRKQKKNQTQEEEVKFDELSNTYENWKSKGNDGTSTKKATKSANEENIAQKVKKPSKSKLFFNKQNLVLKN